MTRPRTLALSAAALALAFGLGACGPGYEATPSARTPVDPYPGESNVGPGGQRAPLAQQPVNRPWWRRGY